MIALELQKLLRSINGERCGSALGDRINQAVQEALLKKEWEEDYMTLAILLQDTRDDALKEGMEKGMEKGKNVSNLRSVQNIMESLQISLEQAMNVLKLSKEERDYCRKALTPAVG